MILIRHRLRSPQHETGTIFAGMANEEYTEYVAFERAATMMRIAKSGRRFL
jgi:hypothetical protein